MKISRTVFNLQYEPEHMVEIAMFNVQRAITPRVGKPELRFMCSAHCLIVLYICVNFGENVPRFMERTRTMGALTDGRADGHSKFQTV